MTSSRAQGHLSQRDFEAAPGPGDRLCGCSFIHAGLSLHEGLILAREQGFSNVDIGLGGANAHFTAVQAAMRPVFYADEVVRETEALQLRLNECFVLNFGVPLNTPDAAIQRSNREHMVGLSDFAARAGLHSIMLLAGPVHECHGREGSRELATEALRDLVEIAGERGLDVNLEADCDSCVGTPEEACLLCESVPGLGLTLDHSHFVCQDIGLPRIETLYPYVRHMHVRQSAPGRIVTPVDEGTVDFTDAFAKLEACGYRGLYCIEYLSLTPTHEARRAAEDQTIAMREYMERGPLKSLL